MSFVSPFQVTVAALEAALNAELSALPELTGKVFALSPGRDAVAPYLFYVSSPGMYEKSLSGFHSSRTVGIELNIIHPTYSGLKTLSNSVLEVVLSFIGRSIGSDGPFIQDVTYEEPVELYEQEIKQYRCNIDLTVYL